MGERERITNESAIKNYNAAVVCTQMAKPGFSQWHTQTHTGTPEPPAPNPGINGNQTKENCLADKCGVFWPREVFPLCTTPFPAPIKQNTSLKRTTKCVKRGQLTEASRERRGTNRSHSTVPEELTRTLKSRSSSLSPRQRAPALS